MTTPPPRVLISYAQGDSAHSQWIAELAARLRVDGLDAIIDQYDPRPAKPWVDWVNDEFRRADWILLACTGAYCLFYEGDGDRDAGRGVRWERQPDSERAQRQQAHESASHSDTSDRWP